MDLSCPLLSPSYPLRHGEGRKICPLINPSAAAHRSTHKERNEEDILSPVPLKIRKKIEGSEDKVVYL